MAGRSEADRAGRQLPQRGRGLHVQGVQAVPTRALGLQAQGIQRARRAGRIEEVVAAIAQGLLERVAVDEVVDILALRTLRGQRRRLPIPAFTAAAHAGQRAVEHLGVVLQARAEIEEGVLERQRRAARVVRVADRQNRRHVDQGAGGRVVRTQAGTNTRRRTLRRCR
ncbi:hypothetical protein G6F46_014110 [Rhizopus delemar]|nr:hypothetical protein G6F46_014110 [Rhizopus delemar]